MKAKALLVGLGITLISTLCIPTITAKAEGTGDFVVSGGELGVAYSFDETTGVLTVNDGANITIANTTASVPTTNTILVPAGTTSTLTLNGINMESAEGTNCIDVLGTATLTVENSNYIAKDEHLPYDKVASGIYVAPEGNVTLNGSGSLDVEGNVTAIGGKNDGAFVGPITIGGNVTIVAENDDIYAATIGSAEDGTFTSITITDSATVTVGTCMYGAAIGTGKNGIGESILINKSATVVAEGSIHGATSIGGGTGGYCKSITITDDVNVKGYEGIGSGGQIPVETTTISGNANVFVTCNKYVSPLGGSYGATSTGKIEVLDTPTITVKIDGWDLDHSKVFGNCSDVSLSEQAIFYLLSEYETPLDSIITDRSYIGIDVTDSWGIDDTIELTNVDTGEVILLEEFGHNVEYCKFIIPQGEYLIQLDGTKYCWKDNEDVYSQIFETSNNPELVVVEETLSLVADYARIGVEDIVYGDTLDYDLIINYTDGGEKAEEEGVVYEAIVENAEEVGIGTVTVSGLYGRFVDSISQTFEVNPRILDETITTTTILSEGEKELEGIFEFEIKYNEITLVEGSDYEVNYMKNEEDENQFVSLQFIGNYDGQLDEVYVQEMIDEYTKSDVLLYVIIGAVVVFGLIIITIITVVVIVCVSKKKKQKNNS